MTYYDAKPTINSDGAPLHGYTLYKPKQDEVKAILERAWKCELRDFGKVCPIDFYALEHGAMVGLIEIKTRSHASDAYKTVYLNVRKWLALTMASVGLAVPAVFVVQFTDKVKFIDVNEVDARSFKIGGTTRIVKSHTDIEPVIEVPVVDMRDLETA